MDESKALYEWKYGKQLLYTQILKDKINDVLGPTDSLNAAIDKLHEFGDIFFAARIPRAAAAAAGVAGSPPARCC